MLTNRVGGATVLVNMARVNSVYESIGGCELYFGGDECLRVKETLGQIEDMISQLQRDAGGQPCVPWRVPA